MQDASHFLTACVIATLLAACGDDSLSNTLDSGTSLDSGVSKDAASSGDRDSSTGSSSMVLDECFADLVAPEDGSSIEVQSFESEDGALKIRRARMPGTRSAVGETSPYDLVRFGVESDGDTHCETRAAQLSYEFGHHNWSERWEARSEQARYVVREELDVLRLQEDFEAMDLWDDTLEVLALASDAQLAAPRALVETGCYTLPYYGGACFKRTRTDKPPAMPEE